MPEGDALVLTAHEDPAAATPLADLIRPMLPTLESAIRDPEVPFELADFEGAEGDGAVVAWEELSPEQQNWLLSQARPVRAVEGRRTGAGSPLTPVDLAGGAARLRLRLDLHVGHYLRLPKADDVQRYARVTSLHHLIQLPPAASEEGVAAAQ